MDAMDSKRPRGSRQASYAEIKPMLDEIPAALKVTRRIRGLSLRAAADEMGVGFNTISRIEAGYDYNVASLRAVIRWLGGGK